jgi:hypothetical protein
MSSVVFGLIAEEVAELFAQLMGYDEKGQPSTVPYQLFTPLLLEQLQRQHRELAKLQAEVAELRCLLAEGSAGSGQGRNGGRERIAATRSGLRWPTSARG